MNHYCLPPEEVIELNRQLIANDFNVLDRGKLEGRLLPRFKPSAGSI